MDPVFSMRLDGDKALEKAMEQLPLSIGRKVVDKALKESSKPLIEHARSIVASVSPTIAKSLGYKMAKKRREYMRLLIVGPKSKKYASGHNPAHTAHLVEGGTKEHEIKSSRGAAVDKLFTGNLTKRQVKKLSKRLDKIGLSLRLRALGPLDGFAIEFASKVKHPGTEPRPFMRPAFDAKGDAAAKVFVEKAWTEIAAEAEKLAKQATPK